MGALELLDWAVRGCVLLAVALLIARVVERRSASLAHRLLVATMGVLLFLPLATLYLPGWGSVSWLATSSAPSTSAVERSPDLAPVATHHVAALPSIEGPDALPSIGEEHSPETFLPNEVATSAEPTPAVVAPTSSIETVMASPEPSPVTTATVAPRTSWNWQPWVIAAWLAIAGVLLLRMVIALWRLRRVASESALVSDSLATEVSGVAKGLGLNRHVIVGLAGEHTMPMACWLGGWRIVLPSNFAIWPAELRTTTLVHELGHVARRDAWSDILVQFVACVAWPIPLVWLALRDIRRLRERACDEWTLARSGLDVKAYAHTLLEVVDRCQRQPVSFAYAMAGPREFESRLAWILTRSRVSMPLPWVGRLAVVGILALGMGIATAMTTRAESESSLLTDSSTSEVPMEEVIVSGEPTLAEPAISVRGMVVDLAGKPIAGANVVLRSNLTSGRILFLPVGGQDILAWTRTNARGEFAFEQIGIPPRMTELIDQLTSGKGGAQVLVWSEGMALAWEDVVSVSDDEKVFRLEPEAEVSGKVTSEEDVPLDGVRFHVVGLSKEVGELDGFMRAEGNLNLILSDLEFGGESKAGRIVIPHLPKDYRVAIRCDGIGEGQSLVLVDTAEETGVGETPRARMRNFESLPLPLDIKTKQRPSVNVRVVDHLGRPVSGGTLRVVDSEHRHGGSVSVGEDGTGLLFVGSSGANRIEYHPPFLSRELAQLRRVDVRPDSNPEVLIKLAEPQPVAGKVVDSDTGAPIPGVAVVAYRADTSDAESTPFRSMGISGQDGRFELSIADGEWKLMVAADVAGYLIPIGAAAYGVDIKSALSEVRLSPGSIPEEIVIPLARGLAISGKVVDANGEPQPGVTVHAENVDEPERHVQATTDASGNYHLAGCFPYVATRVWIWTDEGAADAIVPPTKDQPWEQTLHKTVDLQLQPGSSVKGRVVKGGSPVAGVTVRLLKVKVYRLARDERFSRYMTISETKTDSEGRYRLHGLRRGDKYHVRVEPVGNTEVRDWRYQPPNSHVMEAEDGTALALPDAVMIGVGQQLAGVVVDTEGRPLKGVRVSARLAGGAHLSQTAGGPRPWADTDAEGRFRLTKLPDEPITLMAYRSNPKGGLIKYAAYVAPEFNATNIRILYDPQLGQGIEDLDE